MLSYSLTFVLIVSSIYIALVGGEPKPEHRGLMPEPNCGRGTLSIVWSCLVTIFACSWTVLHPHLPGHLGVDEWFIRDKVLGCLAAIIAPEFLAYEAFADYIDAKRAVNAINKLNKGSCSMKQAYFVSMGGLTVRLKDGTLTIGSIEAGKSKHTQAVYSELQQAIQLDLFRLDQISDRDITARAKTDRIVKAFICIQVTWAVSQIIGRAFEGLAITTLEMTASACVACTLITYLMWWSKPQGVEIPIEIDDPRYTCLEFYRKIYPALEGRFRRNRAGISTRSENASCALQEFRNPNDPLKEVSDIEMQTSNSQSTSMDVRCLQAYALKQNWSRSRIYPPSERIATALITSVFGAIHCAAWNFQFPSVAESILWKVASVLTVSLPPILVLVGFFVFVAISDWYTVSVLSLYSLARLYLLLEVFISLRSLPLSVFQSAQWTNYIPHI